MCTSAGVRIRYEIALSTYRCCTGFLSRKRYKVRIRLKIKIEIELKFDHNKKN